MMPKRSTNRGVLRQERAHRRRWWQGRSYPAGETLKTTSLSFCRDSWSGACICRPDPTCSACRTSSKGQTVVWEGVRDTGAAHHCICSIWSFNMISLFPCVSPENNDNRTICKEIRHNSTGCLKMKDQCAKCQEILSVGKSGSLGPGTSVELPSLVRWWGFKSQLCCFLAVAPGEVVCLLPPGPLSVDKS